jgi:hypothetical protein
MRERLTDNPERMKTATSAAGRREIPEDYKYKPAKIKHLKKVLHNVSVALGTLTSSLNEFSRIKGPDISPDGRLGGVGYIMALTDIKQSINSAVHNLSNVADCIADELTNPRWEASEDKEVKELIKEKDDAVEKVDEVSDDINPDDLVTNEEGEPEEENKPEKSEPEKEPEKKPIQVEKEKEANTILASAVRKSLINFFEISK